MALIGAFDIELRPSCWFDSSRAPEGWFDPDLVDRGITYNLSHTETATATDEGVSSKVMATEVLESLVASATLDSQVIFTVSLDEATAATESASALGILVGLILEASSALDSSQSAMDTQADRLEVLTASDQALSSSVVSGAVTESAVSSDTQDAHYTFVVGRVEVATASDLLVAATIIVVSSVSPVTAADSSASTKQTNAEVSEAALAQSYGDSFPAVYAFVLELAQATEQASYEFIKGYAGLVTVGDKQLHAVFIQDKSQVVTDGQQAKYILVLLDVSSRVVVRDTKNGSVTLQEVGH